MPFFAQARIISPSKSGYIVAHPNNLVAFNAGIYTIEHGWIWFGDLDVTADHDKLVEFANERDEVLYLFRERDVPADRESVPEFNLGIGTVTKVRSA